MSEQERFTYDFIDVRYVKSRYHVLQGVGYPTGHCPTAKRS